MAPVEFVDEAPSVAFDVPGLVAAETPEDDALDAAPPLEPRPPRLPGPLGRPPEGNEEYIDIKIIEERQWPLRTNGFVIIAKFIGQR
jgi:hypothetical protein